MNSAPKVVVDALPEDAQTRLAGVIATGQRVCAGAAYHSPTPNLLHPVSVGGQQTVLLCGTCRDNARVLRILGPKPSWSVRRSFGNRIRGLLGV